MTSHALLASPALPSDDASKGRGFPWKRLALASALSLSACGQGGGEAAPPLPPLLEGRGYVFYHQYPDTGQCYCGTEFDFKAYGKKVAAASGNIHRFFQDGICSPIRYAYVTSERTGKRVRVALVDKASEGSGDFSEREQHIMDLSEEAFDELDSDGAGKAAGRLYVEWEIPPLE